MQRISHAAGAVCLLIVCSIPFCSAAQVSDKDDQVYKASAARLREEVWGKESAHFKDFSVPEKYRGYSKVILASYTHLNVGDAAAVKNAMTRFTMIDRKLIKLNDAAAVSEYSQLSYTQLQKTKSSYLGYKYSSFLGARVIKKNGKVNEVNTDETVFTKDLDRQRDARMAVPDLEPGDILDYYSITEFNIDPKLLRSLPFYFNFYDYAPVLHYEVHCSIGNKFATEFRSYNGAPDLTAIKDADSSSILDAATDSVLLIPRDTKWISPMRQAPIIELNVVLGDAVPYTPFTRRRPGELIRNQDPEKIVRDAMIYLNVVKSSVLTEGSWRMRKKSDVVETYYQSLIKGGKRLQEDSAAAELFYMFRFDYMFGQLFAPNAEAITDMAKKDVNLSLYTYLLSEYSKRHGMAAEVVLSTTNKSAPMNTLMDGRSLQMLCNLPGSHDMLFGVTDLYSPAFYIPASVEGTPDAVAVDTKGANGSYMASKYTSRRIPIPISAAQENQHSEMLSILPDLDNNNLRVRRTTSLTGHCKEDIQHELLLIEDFYNSEREYFNDSRSLAERISDHKDPKGAEEMKAAFASARTKQKDAFLDEAKKWLGQDIIEQANIRIINPGVRHTAPAFEYGSTFRINGVMKKAGNNYLLEIGKLIGIHSRLQEAQRNRSLNVYGPYARTLTVEVNVAVPEGYSVEGLDELKKSIQTNAGSFTATAHQEGNIVNIVVETVFSSGYYANKEWPQLLSLLDATADWTTSKILLRKKG